MHTNLYLAEKLHHQRHQELVEQATHYRIVTQLSNMKTTSNQTMKRIKLIVAALLVAATLVGAGPRAFTADRTQARQPDEDLEKMLVQPFGVTKTKEKASELESNSVQFLINEYNGLADLWKYTDGRFESSISSSPTARLRALALAVADPSPPSLLVSGH